MANNVPYSPAAQHSDLSYSPDRSTIPTKLPTQSPGSLQNSTERQNDLSPKPNPNDQIVSSDHQQHSVRNFINHHSNDTENETDKSQVKFIEESHQLKSTQPSPMDFQSNDRNDDNKRELKGYNPINKESSPTHINNIEHDIKFDKNNDDKSISESYSRHIEGEIDRHNDHTMTAHHHLAQHHHNHHQQQAEQHRDNLNGNLPHEHLDHQSEARHQLQNQQQYHSSHHLQDHQQHIHHQIQQHHHNLGLHDHQSHMQHLDSQHHQPYKL